MPDNFQNPPRSHPQQLRWLRILHEGVARDFGTALGGLLRTAVEVRLADIDRRTYGEFLDGLVVPACFHVLKAAPIDDRLLLDIEPSILHPMIDCLLGGKGDGVSESFSARPPSGIELRLTARMVGLFLEELQHAWKETIELKLDVLQVESNPRQLRVLPTDEAVVQIGFEVSIGAQRGMLRLCLPCRAIGRMCRKSTLEGGSGQSFATEKSPAPEMPTPEISVELSVMLAETQIAGEALDDLRLGDIITTETGSDSPAIVSIEGQPRFHAHPRLYQGRKAICIIDPIEDAPT